MEPKLTKYWFAIYMLAALLILSGFLNLGIYFGPLFEAWLFAQLVPEIWHPAVDDLVHRLFFEEFRAFLVTTGFGLGIIIVGMTLFPLKEKLSTIYEGERFPELKKQRHPPLWRQGLEEVKLAFLYLLLQGMSLFLAVQGYPFLATLGATLSIAYLITAMALDHCSPFFQRRNHKIHGIIWILLRHAPIRTTLLGLICIGPVIILERHLSASLEPTAAIAILVFTEVLGMACATLLGCHLGSALLKEEATLPSQPPPKLWTFSYRITVLILTIWLGVFFSWWGNGVSKQSQIMRCQYQPLWKRTEFKVRGTKALVSLPLRIQNESSKPLDVGKLQIEMEGEGILDGEVILAGSTIQSGETSIILLNFEAQLTEEALLDLPRFLEAEYSAHLKFEPPLSTPIALELFP
jgi:hypothetical protein|tara:strand:+ start:32052 stop:33272 length:1221 start_codon:yes stop_codon:yes gene_type:complete